MLSRRLLPRLFPQLFPRRLPGLGVLLLAACSRSPAPATPVADREVPATAVATPAAYTAFAASLPASGPDAQAQQPLDVNKVTPPTSETDAPVAVH
jgi:hypothetical protein